MKNFIAKSVIFIYLFITFFLMSCDDLCLYGAGMLIVFLIIAQGGFKAFWKRLWSDGTEEQQKQIEKE